MAEFEIAAKDVMGRIGRIETPHGRIETPALLPVINPNIDFISPEQIQKMGAQGIITNAYIIYRTKRLKKAVIAKGLHRFLGFDGVIMTDSGSYQLSVYGDVEISNREIIEFQHEIGSDIITPLDIPTPPSASRRQAEEDLEVTLSRLEEAKELHRIWGDNSLLVAPIQGSVFPDLRKKSADFSANLDFDIYAVGAMVPLMDSYKYDTMISLISEVKSVLPSSCPVHLFGAGHPMVFPVAVALGVDLFDSAAYALYAKDGRYLTPSGTLKIGEITDFPCSCNVCSSHTPDEVRKSEERDRLIAEHNLYISFQEIRAVKQAIRNNTLFEMVEKRIRCHPSLLSGWRIMRKYSDLLEKYDPSYKRSFFYTGLESCFRPAVKRHRRKLKDMEIYGDRIVVSFTDHEGDMMFKPPFGPYPAGLLETYPAGHAEVPGYIEAEAEEIALETLVEFISDRKNIKFILKINKFWKKKLENLKLPGNARVEIEEE